MMTRDQLAHRIYTTSTLTGSFQLRSGAVFHEYFDKYRFEADPKLLSVVAHALHPLVPPEVDALAGLELGGIPLVTMLSQLTGRPARFVRKAAKSYGTCQLAEGGRLPTAVLSSPKMSSHQAAKLSNPLRPYERWAPTSHTPCASMTASPEGQSTSRQSASPSSPYFVPAN